MTLYHGSNTGNIQILEPRLADHDKPYIYMTTIDVVAAFYLCNAVEKPFYWFPYGFEKAVTSPSIMSFIQMHSRKCPTASADIYTR